MRQRKVRDAGQPRVSASHGAPGTSKIDLWSWLLFALIAMWVAQSLWKQTSQVETVPYSQFEAYLREGKLAEVNVGDELSSTGPICTTGTAVPHNFSAGVAGASVPTSWRT